jgi:hypothetical protein
MKDGWTTIHDLTSLALHPTGSRARSHQTNALRDVRGNWIAKDAGGRGLVPKRPSTTGIEDNSEQEEGATERNTRDKGKGKGKAKVLDEDLKDSRARKRRKLTQDVDFLGDQIPTHIPHPINDADDDSLELSIPSSVRPGHLIFAYPVNEIIFTRSANRTC